MASQSKEGVFTSSGMRQRGAKTNVALGDDHESIRELSRMVFYHRLDHGDPVDRTFIV